MGCFSTCFGKSKRQRRNRRRPIKASPSLLDHLQKYESVEDSKVPQLIEDEENIENPIDPTPQSNELKKEKGNVSERKKVTFDLNVKIYEPEEEEEEEELVNGDDSVDVNGGERKADSKKKKKKEETASDSNSSSSSLFSYPANHRYQDCRDSDDDDDFDEVLSSDESEIEYYTDDDEEDEDGDYDEEEEVESEVNNEKPVMGGTQDQSSECLFSLSLESRKQSSGLETGDNKEVNSPMPIKNPNPSDNPRFDRTIYVNSVLNPVENVAQWKVVKAKPRPVVASKEEEEDWESKENLGKDEREIGVNTSLSSWLKVGSEAATPNSKTSSVSVGNSGSLTNNTLSQSPKKFEDRPILGALTLEEIRQFSAPSSPRKSPGFSPDDKPIIGSVGSYWSHTGQSTKSGSSTKTRTRFGENAKVIWDPTPFETRLEKALEEAGLTDEQGLRV